MHWRLKGYARRCTICLNALFHLILPKQQSAFILLLPCFRDRNSRHTREKCEPVSCCSLYPPCGAQVTGTEDGEERVGEDAEHQLGEAVACGVPFPQRERPCRVGATQLGQEPLHRHVT